MSKKFTVDYYKGNANEVKLGGLLKNIKHSTVELEKDHADVKYEEVNKGMFNSSSKTVENKIMYDKIDATQDILDFVVGTDAEDTKGRIDRFVSIINAQIKAAEVSKATGSTPRSYQNNGNVMSEIDKRIAKYK